MRSFFLKLWITSLYFIKVLVNFVGHPLRVLFLLREKRKGLARLQLTARARIGKAYRRSSPRLALVVNQVAAAPA